MRVALYARVSSKVQEKKGTIASQVEALRHHATAHHFEIEENYVCTDEGYSGTLLARPELDRLRDGAQAGAFDAVLVLSPDRLSRKYAYLILILEEFERFGTPVVFLEQPPQRIHSPPFWFRSRGQNRRRESHIFVAVRCCEWSYVAPSIPRITQRSQVQILPPPPTFSTKPVHRQGDW